MTTPLAYTIAEACEVSGVGRTTIYKAIKSGKLIARKFGRRTIILADDLAAWLRSLPKLNTGGLCRRSAGTPYTDPAGVQRTTPSDVNAPDPEASDLSAPSMPVGTTMAQPPGAPRKQRVGPVRGLRRRKAAASDESLRNRWPKAKIAIATGAPDTIAMTARRETGR